MGNTELKTSYTILPIDDFAKNGAQGYSDFNEVVKSLEALDFGGTNLKDGFIQLDQNNTPHDGSDDKIVLVLNPKLAVQEDVAGKLYRDSFRSLASNVALRLYGLNTPDNKGSVEGLITKHQLTKEANSFRTAVAEISRAIPMDFMVLPSVTVEAPMKAETEEKVLAADTENLLFKRTKDGTLVYTFDQQKMRGDAEYRKAVLEKSEEIYTIFDKLARKKGGIEEAVKNMEDDERKMFYSLFIGNRKMAAELEGLNKGVSISYKNPQTKEKFLQINDHVAVQIKDLFTADETTITFSPDINKIFTDRGYRIRLVNALRLAVPLFPKYTDEDGKEKLDIDFMKNEKPDLWELLQFMDRLDTYAKRLPNPQPNNSEMEGVDSSLQASASDPSFNPIAGALGLVVMGLLFPPLGLAMINELAGGSEGETQAAKTEGDAPAEAPVKAPADKADEATKEAED